MDNFTTLLTEKIKSLGISDYGFSDARTLNTSYSDTLPIAVSFVVKLSDTVINDISDGPTFMYYHHYRTVNTFIDSAILQAGMFIETLGYKYMPVGASQSIPDSETPYAGLVSHKAAARQAGLGNIGKSALFISNKFGTRVRLGTLLTDLPAETAQLTEYKSICGRCTLCTDACPAGAIKGVEWRAGMTRDDIFDAKLCSEHMKAAYQHIGRGAVCGKCVQICPRSKG